MNQKDIQEIWPEVLHRLKLHRRRDYSGYSAKGLRGGLRIFDPRGVEVVRSSRIDADVKRVAASFQKEIRWQVLAVSEVEGVLLLLPPWAKGEPKPAAGPTPAEAWDAAMREHQH